MKFQTKQFRTCNNNMEANMNRWKKWPQQARDPIIIRLYLPQRQPGPGHYQGSQVTKLCTQQPYLFLSRLSMFQCSIQNKRYRLNEHLAGTSNKWNSTQGCYLLVLAQKRVPFVRRVDSMLETRKAENIIWKWGMRQFNFYCGRSVYTARRAGKGVAMR